LATVVGVGWLWSRSLRAPQPRVSPLAPADPAQAVERSAPVAAWSVRSPGAGANGGEPLAPFRGAAIPTPVGAPDQNEDPKAERARQIALHHTAIDQHYQEPRDPKWERKTEAKLGEDLRAFATQRHFELDEVDCRARSCVATVEFPSYNDAQAGWKALLFHGNLAGCGTEITLDEAQDPTAPYRTTIFYDCAMARANEH
jgi:hypothetical protein